MRPREETGPGDARAGGAMGGTTLLAACASDLGKVREENEDSVLVLPDVGVFCVADGMGGAEGGAIASQRTLEVVRVNLARSQGLGGLPGRVKTIHESLDEASVWIQRWAAKKSIQGTGSTVICLAVADDGGSGMLVHAGDSRAYRLRDGRLELLSEDHSMATMLGTTDRDSIPPMLREVVTRAVGVHAEVDAEDTPIDDVCVGDLFLLCSDGLSKMVSDTDTERILNAQGRDLARAARALVAAANHAGGRDNTSVVLVRVAARDGRGPVVPSEPRWSLGGLWRRATAGVRSRVGLGRGP